MASQQLTITLPEHLIAFVADRVTKLGYADAGDVVIEALELSWADEVLVRREFDEEFARQGIKEEARAAYAAYRADPTNVFTSEQVLAHIRERHGFAVAAV